MAWRGRGALWICSLGSYCDRGLGQPPPQQEPFPSQPAHHGAEDPRPLAGEGRGWAALHTHPKHILSHRPPPTRNLSLHDFLMCVSSSEAAMKCRRGCNTRVNTTLPKHVHHISHVIDLNNSNDAKQPNGALRNKWSRKQHQGGWPAVCLSVCGEPARALHLQHDAASPRWVWAAVGTPRLTDSALAGGAVRGRTIQAAATRGSVPVSLLPPTSSNLSTP